MFDTLVVRSFMTPSIAALLGRWFWWPQAVRPRPASALLQPYGSRSLVRSLLLNEHAVDGRSPERDHAAQRERLAEDADTQPLLLVGNGHRRQVKVPTRFAAAQRDFGDGTS